MCILTIIEQEWDVLLVASVFCNLKTKFMLIEEKELSYLLPDQIKWDV